MSKVCKCCGIEKSIEEFPFHNKAKGTYRAECNICYNEKRRNRYTIPEVKEKRKVVNNNSYKKHSEKRKQEVINYRKNNPDKVKVYQEKVRQKNREKFYEFKSKFSCSECGESHIACLDFHHLDPNEKEGSISKMISTPIKLEKELKKCIVLCANCHRKLHWDEKYNI